MSPHRIATAAAVLLCACAGVLGSAASAQTPSPSASGSSPAGSATPSPSASAPAEQSLALLLSAEPATVALGDETVLVAQVTNTGDAATPSTSVAVTLPPQLELESSFPARTGGAGRTHTFDLGSLDPGASAVVQITASATAVVEDAFVTAAATAGTATAEGSTTVSVTEGGTPAGLTVSSRARGLLTQVGSMLRYEVVVANVGDTDLENVLVVDVSPAEVDVVSVDIVDEVEAVQIGESGGRHDIVWNVGSLPAGTSVELPWDGRVARPGDLKAVNSVRGLLGTTEATRSSSESFLAAEGPRDLENPPFEPIEERVVTFEDPPAGPAARAATQAETTTQPGAVLPFTGAAPWQIVRAGVLLVLGGLLLVLGTRLAREPRKAVVAALLAGLVGVACVSANDDEPGDAAAPVASPRTFATGDPMDEGDDETRVKGERIVRGDEGSETPAPTGAPAATPPPSTVAPTPPTTTPPPVVAAPATAPPPVDRAPVRVVRVVRTELDDLPVEDLRSRGGDNTISFGWDEAVGITSATSGTRVVRGAGSELLTNLSQEGGRISNRMTLRNTADATRLRVRGRLVHDVYQGGRLVARLRSESLDVVLAPGGEVVARFAYLLPTGDYTVEAAFVASQ